MVTLSSLSMACCFTNNSSILYQFFTYQSPPVHRSCSRWEWRNQEQRANLQISILSIGRWRWGDEMDHAWCHLCHQMVHEKTQKQPQAEAPLDSDLFHPSIWLVIDILCTNIAAHSATSGRVSQWHMQGSGLIGPDCTPSHSFQRKSHLKSESCESCVSSTKNKQKTTISNLNESQCNKNESLAQWIVISEIITN